jgi:alanine-glyoxylate transaminase/serine-glyoxylate transaminase/serine-pyruvate transaminase
MVHPRVYEALSKPIVGHLDPYFIQVMGDVQQLLKAASKRPSEPRTAPH